MMNSASDRYRDLLQEFKNLDEDERKAIVAELLENSPAIDDSDSEEELDLDDLPVELKPFIEKLPREQQSRAIEQLSVQLSMRSQYSGPIPPPKFLSQFEEIVPGSAERILAMAERQSAHRQSLESIVIPDQLSQSSRGQTFAFILSILAIIAACFLGYIGQTVVASIIGGGTIVSLVYAFVLGKKKADK